MALFQQIPNHLYLNSGCNVLYERYNRVVKLNLEIYQTGCWHEDAYGAFPYKLILRRLDSMTQDEWMMVAKIHTANGGAISIDYNKEMVGTTFFTPEVFNWLLNKGFWVFDNAAFEAGQIIDAATL